MLLALATLPVHAATGDLQLRVHRPALDFAEVTAAALDPFLQEDLFEQAPYECWDRVGLTDFNLSVPINTLTLEADDGVFRVDIAFGDLLGTGWTVFSEDTEYLDACVEFETEVERFAVTDGTFSGALEPYDDDGAVNFRWVGDPFIDGTIDSDIAWVPDDLILYFVEDLVFEQASLAVQDALPVALDEALAEPLLDGEFEGYDVTMTLADAEVTDDGLAFGVDTTVGFVGTPACDVPVGPRAPGGRSPELTLAPVEDGHLTVGLTESFVNQLFFAAWEAGSFCYAPDTFDTLARKMAPLVDPDVTGLEGLASLDEPAELTFTDSGGRLALTGQRLTVVGYRNGNQVTVLDTTLDLTGKLRFGFAPNLRAVTVTVHDLDVTFGALELNHDRGGLKDVIRPYVQEWAARAIEDELKRIPVYDSLLYALDFAIEIVDVTSEAGGVAIGMRLWDVDDASVDRVAPDTEAELVSVSGRNAEVAWDGSDDRDGPVVWAWQLDGGGWSDWTTSQSVRLEALAEGSHTVAVKARDNWLNEDPTPAEVSFRTGAAGSGLTDACGCAGAGGTPALAGLLVGLAAALRRRREKGEAS